MTHAKGTYLGGVRAVKDLRERSRVDEITGCWCWSLETSACSSYVHFVLNGVRYRTMGRKAALLLAGIQPESGQEAFATPTCSEPTCVNPKHARWGTKSERMADLVARGRLDHAASIAALARANAARAKTTAADRVEIALSTGLRAPIAQAHDITVSRVSQIRRSARRASVGSVFEWRP